MQTVFIWCEDNELPEFAVLSGDWTRFDGCIIGSGEEEALEDELNDSLPFGWSRHLTANFPVEAVKDGAFVVTAGRTP